jgi:glycogen debranching enzyme
MDSVRTRSILFLLCLLIISSLHSSVAHNKPFLITKFNLRKNRLELERHIRPGTFFDVLGRRSALFGYENSSFEAWVYPLKILDNFHLSFQLQGYPLDIQDIDIASSINVRPEATTFIYSHAAFTVRQIIFAPIEEPGIIMLLDVQSVLPLKISCSFRPKLHLMWPAGLMTGYVDYDKREQAYYITEETHRFVAMIGSPLVRDISLMPYQEEPRNIPLRFEIDVTQEEMKSYFVPIIIAGSTQGRDNARNVYQKLLGSVQSLYENNVLYYDRLLSETISITTPDDRLNNALEWAKIGIDKGVVTNPMLGTGLVAGYRTSGESERPGFAWFFGRDALWTAFAVTSYGDFRTTKVALDFLKNYQREDGKIPHEISQSATFIPWFKDYPYPWASADATPLYIIAHADYWRASGDIEFIKKNWNSIVKAYRFTAATDTDKNGLIENTNVGHGWVEGGALYPPHEEIYMQALWVAASSNILDLARVLNDQKISVEAHKTLKLTIEAIEQNYWLSDRGYYAFATSLPSEKPRIAEQGPNLERRQARLNELSKLRLIDEDTVLPAVGLWMRVLDSQRAQSEIDHLGSGSMLTDWGARILSNQSDLYDPLSYHYGSVWPLFTGWVSLGAYNYGRPHIGYEALMANTLLTYDGALGYITELLSGDLNSAFGRSSHHQVWSEAMLVTPLIRGLLGIEVEGEGKVLKFAPQLPANWNRVVVRNIAVGNLRYDIELERVFGQQTIQIKQQSSNEIGKITSSATRIIVAPAFPLDARLKSVLINGKESKFQINSLGDIQRAQVSIEDKLKVTQVIYNFDEGTDVYNTKIPPAPGASSEGLRILRSRSDPNLLHLVVEGVSRRTYQLSVRTPKRIVEPIGTKLVESSGSEKLLLFNFEGPRNSYARRDLRITLAEK